MQFGIFDPYLVLVLVFAFWLSYSTSFICDALEKTEEDALLIPQLIKFFSNADKIERKPWIQSLFFSVALSGLVYISSSGNTAYAIFILVALCIPASIMDIRFHIIPEEFTWALLFSGMLLSPWALSLDSSVQGAAIGCGAMWFALTLVGYMKGEDTRSGGDVAAAAAGGAWVGVEYLDGYLLSVALVFLIICLIGRHKGIYWYPMGPALFVAIPLSEIVSDFINKIAFTLL